ncbi:MAG TPA: sodium:solute symporter family protein [Candidatus Acidoferrales bacterium]|nr:sodium:solute symporter family protein [Candidatus Acidoferrales bacterium]
MSEAAIALSIVAVVVVAVMALASLGARGILMDPEQYIVGGRSFGVLFLWLLTAGEVYTTFTFLGASGWAYGKGAPAFYILCYGPLAYIISYFLQPPIWRVAKRFGLLTGPDFFAQRYQSRALGVIVALTGFVFLIPYVTLQLTGLEILLGIAGYGHVGTLLAVQIAFLLTAIFVYTSGLRGLAWASVAKDLLVLAAVGFIGIVVPLHFFRSPGDLVSHVVAAHPQWMTLIGGGSAYGTRWFVTTVLLTAVGFMVWPQAMANAYAAKSDEALRRNAIFMPVYNVMLVLVILGGFTALAIAPGLHGAAADRATMLLVQGHYPAWVLGSVAAAGCLAALIPVSSQLLAAASVVSKNVLGDWLNIATNDRARTFATRLLVLIVAILALWFWEREQTTIVDLLLLAYNGVAQFFPGTVLAFAWKRTTALGVGSGIVAGLLVLILLSRLELATLDGVNVGLVALVVNCMVCIAVSCISRPPGSEHVATFVSAAQEQRSS